MILVCQSRAEPFHIKVLPSNDCPNTGTTRRVISNFGTLASMGGTKSGKKRVLTSCVRGCYGQLLPWGLLQCWQGQCRVLGAAILVPPLNQCLRHVSHILHPSLPYPQVTLLGTTIDSAGWLSSPLPVQHIWKFEKQLISAI